MVSPLKEKRKALIFNLAGFLVVALPIFTQVENCVFLRLAMPSGMLSLTNCLTRVQYAIALLTH